MSDALERWEPVIGLEVHVHLKTDSKMFCRCPVRYGEEPNHQICPVCLALPGALPVLNRHAVDLAVRAGLAMGGTVHPRSVFARKNYFYPDLPKGYQISQYEEPIVTEGFVEIEVEGDAGEPVAKRIGLTRIHMEEDAGKSIHGEWEREDESHMDLNRAGIPLLEVVSEPDIRSAAEASAYLRALRAILRHTGVSDGDMEKGQMRCDVNLSLRPRGSDSLGTRTETKNLNSYRFVEGAIEAEIERQAETLEKGGAVDQATMLYDSESGRTSVMRVKENADDYRYFPDPDLIPLEIDPAGIEDARGQLPELPDRKRARFEAEYGLSAHDARVLTASRALADFFESAARDHGDARSVANWVLRDVLQVLKERDAEIEETPIVPESLAALMRLVDGGRVTPQSAREVLRELVERGGDPDALVRERGLEAVSDAGLLESTVGEVLAAHPEMVGRFRGGQTNVLNFLMGQVMRRTAGKANPGLVREILSRKLEE
jgi:aspartyl-tRNA(Asn)/glutamyl-tRNA(Gln) amidotransferase subunit B